MPELPEVETVRKTLKRQIIGKKILKVDILYNGIIASNLNDFKKKIINQEFIDIKRIGKYLIFELNNYYLVSHLRMEGKFFIKNIDDDVVKHEHVIFTLSDVSLRYHDTRKFGKMYLVDKDKLFIDTPLINIGKDPWDKSLNIDYLKEKFNSSKHIKTLLLDQSIISGIGNIYADEILFKSKINPLRLGKDLNDIDLLNIISNTKDILERSIEHGGTTIRSYTSSLGVIGHFQDYLMVHQREGIECMMCHNIIKKIKVNGRGTYYCPNCQVK